MKKRWPEVILLMCAVCAVTVLLTVPFRRPTAQVAFGRGVGEFSAEELDLQTMEQAYAIVRELGHNAIPVLLDQVRQGKASQHGTIAAIRTLGPSVAPALVSAINDSSDAVRLVAIRTISALSIQLESRADSILPTLVQMLNDANPDVRLATVLAVARFGPSRAQATHALIGALAADEFDREEDSICMQQSVAHLLGRIGLPAREAIPALQKLFDDRKSVARFEAAVALWRISHDTNLVLVPLFKMMEDPIPLARDQAATALWRISHDHDLSPPLLAKVENLTHRSAARKAY